MSAAAWRSLTRSAPFQPLPKAFSGPALELQVHFQSPRKLPALLEGWLAVSAAGIQPDLPVHLSRADYIRGTDSVLDAALRSLQVNP